MHKTFLIFTRIASQTQIAHSAMAAGAGVCYNVADADARTYCLARAHQRSGQCCSIQNSTTRSMCLAEIRK